MCYGAALIGDAMADHSVADAQGEKDKQSVAASSMAAAVLLTTMKIVVGILSGSIGILAEAAHSGLDLVAAAVTLWAVRASGRPADAGHPYGHGKIENFSALFETGLLVATCLFIGYEASRRLISGEGHVEVSVWSFVVMFVSIVVDVSRSRALDRAAKEHNSQALAADALHFATDVWSSSVVIVGLAAVWLSGRLQLPWLARADAVAALGVAIVALVVSVRLGKQAVDDLLDAAPEGVIELVAHAARVDGVLAVLQVRVRQSGAHVFTDLRIEVAKGTSFDGAHEIAHRVEAAIRQVIPKVDVVVHTDPADGPEAAAPSAVQA
jgi:cation diffusion facilitator family transporter